FAPAAAVMLVLGACQNRSDAPSAAVERGLQLDESVLLQPIRFSRADVDPAISACVDLGAHTNSRWLAANPIPADQTSWGAFNVLAERSLQVQKQLAEQAVARTSPTGIERIVADFWATGMDEEKRNADGAAPLASRLDEIAA